MDFSKAAVGERSENNGVWVMCDTIRVFLHKDDNEPVEVTVNKYDAIRSLLDNSQQCIIFDNLFLCESFSFSFYQIESGSHIYSKIIPSKHKTVKENKKRDSKAKLSFELDKLKDRFFDRVEGSFRVHRRVVNRFAEEEHTQTVTVPVTRVEWNFVSAQKPSTTALPMIWDSLDAASRF